MVSVPVPTLAADAIVDRDVDFRVELQSEGVGRGEWIASLTPTVAQLATSHNGTL